MSTPGSQNLFAKFEVGQDSQDLFSKFVCRNVGSQNLFGKFVVRQTGSANLFAKIIINASEDLFVKFICRNVGSANLFGTFIVRHKASLNLLCKFAVRPEYPLWTSRTLLNGVIDLAEKLLGDAKLEFVIEGVMDDIMVWFDANSITYSGWTNIDLTPRAVKRATTYGVVAALYARHTKTFQGRVIPTVTPVTITVVGDDERAMVHWAGKMMDMLQLYLSAQGATRFWVSTQDEEPVFTMEDIPVSPEDVDNWHNYLQEQI